MNNSIQIIPFANLALAFIPVVVVIVILYKWSLGIKNTFYALSRMLIQLLVIGYFLAFIFEAKSAWIVLAVLTVMILASSWIALRTTKIKRSVLYTKTLYSLIIGGGITFLIVTQAVLNLEPWYAPPLRHSTRRDDFCKFNE